MLNAATMGGVAFQKGLGVTHSLAHALSTVCDLHHGLANGIAISYAMEFNAEVAADRLADLARAAGAKQPDAAGFITWLRDLRAAIGIPSTLRDAGVKVEHLPRLIEVAVADACHPNNPRPVTEPDFRELFTKALG
jgi:alcohol dehydrogenase class IV